MGSHHEMVKVVKEVQEVQDVKDLIRRMDCYLIQYKVHYSLVQSLDLALEYVPMMEA